MEIGQAQSELRKRLASQYHVLCLTFLYIQDSVMSECQSVSTRSAAIGGPPGEIIHPQLFLHCL